MLKHIFIILGLFGLVSCGAIEKNDLCKDLREHYEGWYGEERRTRFVDNWNDQYAKTRVMFWPTYGIVVIFENSPDRNGMGTEISANCKIKYIVTDVPLWLSRCKINHCIASAFAGTSPDQE